MDTPSRSIRRTALEKIAALSATSSSQNSVNNTDLERLCQACPGHVATRMRSKSNASVKGEKISLARLPMHIREFEVLLALCKAAPALTSTNSAERLAIQLIPYILEAQTQVFVPSPFFREVDLSPVEALSYNLTTALLTLGINHKSLQEHVAKGLWSYLGNCVETAEVIVSRKGAGDNESAEVDDAIETATLTLSLLGFLDAASTHAEFWTASQRHSLVEQIKRILSEPFLVSVETAFSTLRNSHTTERNIKDWKRHVRHYAAIGRPLGAMLLQRSLMWLLVASSSLLIVDVEQLRKTDVLDVLLASTKIRRPEAAGLFDSSSKVVETMADISAEQMSLLEDGADYLRLGSAWQQRLAFSVKASALTNYLNCTIINEEVADADILMAWLEDTLADSVQMADDTLASVVLRCMALICKVSPSFGPNVSRLLPRYLVQGSPHGQSVSIASQSLAYVLKLLSQDAIITTLYSLGNILSSGGPGTALAGTANGEHASNGSAALYGGKQATGSSISLTASGEEETTAVYGNVIQAICGIASSCVDPKITALAQSMLLQKSSKVGKAVDARIFIEAAVLAVKGGPLEFKALMKVYARICNEGVAQKDELTLHAVLSARNYLSSAIERDSQLFDIYLEHLLEIIVSRGEFHQSNDRNDAELDQAAREISQVLQPLAILMAKNNLSQDDDISEDISSLIRDAWFNIVVHGFAPSTERGKSFSRELRLMAIHSRPLVAEYRGEQVESDIELNTILRRGMNSEHEAMQKKILSGLLPSKASEIRSLSYRKIIFFQAAYLVESLRAESGDCTKTLSYFLEPSMRTGDMSMTMEALTMAVTDTYLRKTVSGNYPNFTAPYVAKQLVSIFSDCCHRIERVQQTALRCASKIILAVPSSLCEKTSLFALLELLSLMWLSCLEAETDEYDVKSSYTSARGGVTILLSDNFELRKRTLNALYRNAKEWVRSVIDIAPLDVKSLLQTYLSEYDDDYAFGHISLGRSFASEMGAVIPKSDHKLQVIDRHGDCNINTASDFVAQYTSRQEYRYAEALPDHSSEWLSFINKTQHKAVTADSDSEDEEDILSVLARIETRTVNRKYVPISELRDILRRAAALLCRNEKNDATMVHYLVRIPFAQFSKQTIQLGISLWLNVINENPKLEPRILTEIAQQWEVTIRQKLGLFNSKKGHSDPFYVKFEFAPTDREANSKHQHQAHNALSAHTRLLQFLASHFEATRFGSRQRQEIFLRLLRVSLDGLRHATGHPLSRELRLQLILFGLTVLHHSTGLSAKTQWRVRDQILSAGLSWFAAAPTWSFGSNRLQLKAETRLMINILALIKTSSRPECPTEIFGRRLQAKQALLVSLLESEIGRLLVWLSPLGEARGSSPNFASASKGFSETDLIGLVRVAWQENPALAIQLATRFYISARLRREIRTLLLKSPEKAINEPDALPILIDNELLQDIGQQLKYLLYWEPVNPVTAVSYFTPAYRHHPYLIQYAMRALESHSVDVTFFFVPQIVQTLRYDELGYVERYILETAKFSQLFAHQIIWNMKANAYKDEDAEIPDSIKPVLDKVMDHMISSFSAADRAFYEKEFSFFDEVTGISGKLKPFIKRPKPEKKQKIEEELRKIKVEIGVYLPSNPDGVVIGIDRKSGKPLQSHAKAPYMATFRIKKNSGDVEETGDLLEESAKSDRIPKDNTVEIWQSAIFKVGDDCRQDVLALQMIAAFRGIFNSVGLDVYVFPYRVTATAPGCGVIDVLPNSISRDMLGREAVNGLYEYFISKYGNEDSLRFQEARSNFVKSLAAYSVITYLLQFKDRHNGNIMLDDAGHILHIDFGFCFDIAPGGVKFERAPFKLTSEMVAVMGGSPEHQAYKWFEELCIKSFLAARQHTEKLAQIVQLMMDSGLPCFKPETIQNFKDRFVLNKTEREAAEYMRGLIKFSHGNRTTQIYDQFQLMTNGIPY